MNKKFLYNIRDLKCSYNKNESNPEVVLQIEALQIPQGGITFFVGPSGVGKSTILETLGAMNNTILSVGTLEYNGYDMSKIWTWTDSKLSEFRNEEFSFVFQDTNLMPNFTALENVMTTGLFQGQNKNQAQKMAEEVLENLGVDISKDRSIDKFSGGQRQRIAFARAIMPSFNVLFGDEPTGNLDSHSAEDLMKLLKDNLRKKKASAIIVSHDLRIATMYADLIVNIKKITKSDNSTYGLIDSESLYVRDGKGWHQKEKIFSDSELIDQIWK